MKTTKTLWALVAFAIMGVFASCQSDDDILEPAAEQSELNFNITVDDKLGFGPSTRANASGWEAGDEILALFDIDKAESAEQIAIAKAKLQYRKVTFVYDGTKWNATKNDGFEFNESGKMSVVHATGSSGLTLKEVGTAVDNIYLADKDGARPKSYIICGNNLDYTYDKTTKTLTATITFKTIVNDLKIKIALLPPNWYLSCFNESASRTENIHTLYEANESQWYFSYGTITGEIGQTGVWSGPNPMTDEEWQNRRFFSCSSPGVYYFRTKESEISSIKDGDATVFRVANASKNATKVWERMVAKKLRRNLEITLNGPVNPDADVAVDYTDTNGWKLVYKE